MDKKYNTKFSLEEKYNMLELYSTNCPKCKVLETKLKQKNIDYEVCTDIEKMKSLKIMSAPILEMDDGNRLNFTDAVKWVNAI